MTHQEKNILSYPKRYDFLYVKYVTKYFLFDMKLKYVFPTYTFLDQISLTKI